MSFSCRCNTGTCSSPSARSCSAPRNSFFCIILSSACSRVRKPNETHGRQTRSNGPRQRRRRTATSKSSRWFIVVRTNTAHPKSKRIGCHKIEISVLRRQPGRTSTKMKADPARVGTLASPRPSVLSIWPHRLAVLLVCATFPLLFIGGLVTGKGAGLAVPDWPTTFGYNMFLYPWSKMVGNIFYEHSHRLVAAAVGLLTIALALAFWLQERRHWLRRLGVAALLLVILQGVIGGLRVVLLEHTLAIVHAAFAQAFFALTVSLTIFTSPDWTGEPKDQLGVDD